LKAYITLSSISGHFSPPQFACFYKWRNVKANLPHWKSITKPTIASVHVIHSEASKTVVHTPAHVKRIPKLTTFALQHWKEKHIYQLNNLLEVKQHNKTSTPAHLYDSTSMVIIIEMNIKCSDHFERRSIGRAEV
ncbi:hypothetical protein T09_5751, partial [Trichinella sp. T9]